MHKKISIKYDPQNCRFDYAAYERFLHISEHFKATCKCLVHSNEATETKAMDMLDSCELTRYITRSNLTTEVLCILYGQVRNPSYYITEPGMFGSLTELISRLLSSRVLKRLEDANALNMPAIMDGIRYYGEHLDEVNKAANGPDKLLTRRLGILMEV